MEMTPETDLDALKENYTPRQRENFESHLKPKLDRLDRLPELAAEAGGDPDAVAEAAELAREWLLRTYRPKARNEGLIERDHVKIGQPEHYFKKWLGKLNSPYGSIQGLVMAGFSVSGDTRDEVETAATAVWVADHLKDQAGAARLQDLMEEHDEVARLYGV